MNKCWLLHDWIYSEYGEMYCDNRTKAIGFNKRTCNKCGKQQLNSGYFDTSFGNNNYVTRWKTIGFVELHTAEGVQKNGE